MTAPADIPALIAEGRQRIAAATPGPLEVDAIDPYDVITRHYEPVAEHESRAGATLHVFAVNHLAALLDVAEAATEARAAETEPDDNVAPYPLGPRVCHEYGCPCTKIGKKFGPCDCGGAAIQERIDASRAALDSALSKLREVRT